MAVWSHKQLAALDPRIGFEHEGNTSWSQDEGLALFPVIDRLVPNWQRRMFDGVPPAPFRFLETALEGDDDVPAAR